MCNWNMFPRFAASKPLHHQQLINYQCMLMQGRCQQTQMQSNNETALTQANCCKHGLKENLRHHHGVRLHVEMVNKNIHSGWLISCSHLIWNTTDANWEALSFCDVRLKCSVVVSRQQSVLQALGFSLTAEQVHTSIHSSWWTVRTVSVFPF